MRKMTKRGRVRLITFLSVSVSVLAIFAIIAAVKAVKYERIVEASYERNLNEAVEYVSDMDDTLSKGLYSVSSRNMSDMCSDLWRDCYEAKDALSQLPLSSVDLEKCYTFLSKVAEYSKSLEKDIASGKTIDDKSHNTLSELKTHVGNLHDNLTKLQDIYVNSDSRITGGMSFSFDAPQAFSASSVTTKNLTSANDSLADVPELIYDGPFSDSNIDKDPEVLKNEQKITKARARSIAKEALKNKSGDFSNGYETKGLMSGYNFKKGNALITISAKGGKIINITGNESVENSIYSNKQCLEKAKVFLTKLGYKNMTCNYYEKANGIFTANFNYCENNIHYYTDLIKVEVNSETGEVCGFDATTYLTNHKQRQLGTPKLTSAKAKSKISKYLKVQSSKMALIPTASGKERYCYEFRCKTDKNNELLVYIDANTGEEADILILQISRNAVVTK